MAAGAAEEPVCLDLQAAAAAAEKQRQPQREQAHLQQQGAKQQEGEQQQGAAGEGEGEELLYHLIDINYFPGGCWGCIGAELYRWVLELYRWVLELYRWVPELPRCCERHVPAALPSSLPHFPAELACFPPPACLQPACNLPACLPARLQRSCLYRTLRGDAQLRGLHAA